VIVTCILPPDFLPTLTTIPPTEVVPPIPPPAPAPVSQVPGKIEAEDYTAWYDTTPGNTGGAYRNDDVDIEACPNCTNGFNVGWIATGEWLEYPVNVRADGAYQIHVRVATTYNDRRVRFLLNGTDVTGWMPIPSTDGWQNWTVVTSNAFAMTTGSAVLRMETDVYGFNIDTIAVIPADAAPIPTATPGNEPIPTATSGAYPIPTATSGAEPVPTTTPTNEPVPTATPGNEPPPTGGTAYYIDAQNGNDANNGLSAETAWRTLAKVNATTFAPGSQILLRRGQVWQEGLVIPNSGEAGKPITVSAYGDGDHPVIDCASACDFGIFIDGKSHIRIDGLEFRNAERYGMYIQAQGGGGYEIVNNKVSQSVHYGMKIFNANDSLIDNNEVYANGRSGIGVLLDNPAYTSHRVTISNNRVYDNAGPGIDPDGLDAQHSEQHGYHIIINNTVYRNGDGIYLHYTVHNTVANNLVHENNNQTWAGEGDGIALSSGVHYNQIYDNTVYGQRAVGIHVWAGTPTPEHPKRGPATYNDIYRNHVHNNSKYGIFFSAQYVHHSVIAYNLVHHNGDRTLGDKACVGKPAGQQKCGFGMHIYSYDGPDGPGHVIANNTIVNNAGKGIQVTGDAPIEVRNNIFSGNYAIELPYNDRLPSIKLNSNANVFANCYNEDLRTDSTNFVGEDIRSTDPNAAFGDPQFIGGDNYRLQAGSPCWQAGRDQQGAPYEKDLDRTSVPNPPFRGAYGS
jgi:parallel beta-helix repeat protein